LDRFTHRFFFRFCSRFCSRINELSESVECLWRRSVGESANHPNPSYLSNERPLHDLNYIIYYFVRPLSTVYLHGSSHLATSHLWDRSAQVTMCCRSSRQGVTQEAEFFFDDSDDDGGIDSGPGAPTVRVSRVICRNKMYFYFYLTTYLS
jgi:hypothetical protein